MIWQNFSMKWQTTFPIRNDPGRDVLKTLLIKEELEVLENLKKLLSEEQFTEEVSKVLANALKRAQKKRLQTWYCIG